MKSVVSNRRSVARAILAASLIGVFALSGLSALMPQTAVAATGINHTVNFQGKVTNTDGTNVTNGTYSFVFKIYTVSTGGSAVWTETKSLAVSDGIFQTQLGDTTTLPGSVDFNTDNIYLGMAFNSDPEMSPRIQFTAVPQAFNSEKLGGIAASGYAQINPGSAQAGSLNIGTSVQAGTSLQAPLLDTATAAALSVGTVTATSVTVGRATSTTNLTLQGSASTSWSATGASGSTTVGFAAPSGTNSISFPNAGGTVCTTVATTCSSVYQTTSGSGAYLAKGAVDTSSASVAASNYFYGFTNTNTAVSGGVLNLDNGSNTGAALNVTASGNPGSGKALIVATNTNGSPSGNLLDLRVTAGSMFAVDAAGNVTQNGGTATTTTINGQRISAAANFTGTVTVGTGLTITTGGLNVTNTGITNAGAISGVTTLAASGTITGGGTFKTADTAVASTASGAVSVTSGNASGTGGTSNSGAVTVDSGTSTNGTTGAVNIGTTNASAVTVGRANSAVALTLQGSASSVFTATGASGTTTVNFTAPTANVTYNYGAATVGTYTICTTFATSCSSVYQAAGSYLAKAPTATESSSSTIVGAQYSFANTNNGAAGVLTLANSGTNAALSVSQSGNPSANQALILATNTNGTPSGNLLDLRVTAGSMFAIDSAGSVIQNGGTATTTTINGQRISAAANFTGTLTVATGLYVSNSFTVGAGGLDTANGQPLIVAAGQGLKVTGTITSGGTFKTVDTSAASTASGAATFTSGNASGTGGTSNSGAVSVDSGTSTNGTTGAVNVGTTNASAVTVGRANSTIALTLQGSASSVFTATGASGTTTVNFTAPTAAVTYNFGAATVGTYGICTTYAASCSSVYQAAGSYIAKNPTSTESSSSTIVGNQYSFANTNTGAAGVLTLINSGTNSALSVSQSANPTANQALILATNTNGTPSGNLLDLRVTAGSRLAVDFAGNVTQNGGTATTTTINGQTISAAANFTGTVTSATGITITTGGLNVTNSGITNAGAISGVTTLTGSGTITGGGTFKTADTAVASTASAGVSITSGNASGTGGTSNSGAVNVDSGTSTNGTTGAVNIGTGNAASVGIGKSTTTTTVNGTTQLGASTGTGALLNNGATVNTAYPMANLATGGWDAGGATATVDKYTYISANQTTSGQTLTIPSPSANTTYGRLLFLSNIGNQSFTLLGTTIGAGSTATLVWANATGGAKWTFAGADGSGILNQNGSDQTADFRISGTGRANTSFISPLFDSISGALNLGTGTATGITIGGSSTTGTIAIGNSAASTISIGTGAQAHTIGIGTDATTVQGVTIGSSSGASATTLVAGSGNLNLNAANINTNQTTSALLNTTATTVNAFGAATAVNFGASGSTFTLGNTGGTATVKTSAGSLTLQGASALTANTANAAGAVTGGITIATGNVTSGAFQSGSIGIDVGTSSGTTGTVSLGTGNASAVSIGRTGVTTTHSGTNQIGASAGTGLLVNNGSTLNSTLAVLDDSDGGTLGGIPAGGLAASASVDIYTSISIAQTTTGQTITLPTPSNPTTVYGKLLYISNIGSAGFTLLSATMSPGTTATLVWANANGGAKWTFAGADGNGILNQNSAQQPTSNFWISGTGRADTSFTAPLFDSNAGGLNIGTSTATGITLGGATTTGTIAIGNSAASTISIGTGAQAHTIGIGTDASTVQGVSIGSSSGASATTLTAGSGNLNLNAANINTNQTTVALLNTTAATVNAFGNATAMNLGATSSILTLGNTGGTATLRTTAGALTVTSAAAATWSTTAGVLTLSGGGGTSVVSANAASATGAITIQSGNVTSGAAASGNITVDAGSITSGTAGTVSVGTANASAVTVGRTGVTTKINGSTQLGTSTGTGALVNNGSTVNTTLAVANDSDGGTLGGTPAGGLTAAASVDIYTSISINQTTTGQTITLPTPSNPTTVYGKLLYVSNIGTAIFTMSGASMGAGTTATLVWANANGGDKWTFAGADGNGILNQSTVQQAASSYWISGSGRADTSLLTPLLDTPTGTTTLNIGTTNATSGINLNQSTTVASGKNLTITSGNLIVGPNNSEHVTVSGTGRQYVQITTTSVGGEVGLNYSNTVGSVLTGLAGSAGQILDSGAANDYIFNNRTGGAILFSADTAHNRKDIYVTSSNGNVGIGTGTANYKLDVAGDVNSSTKLLAPVVDTASGVGLTVASATATSLALGRTGITTTVNGTTQVGASTGTGGLVNNGSTVNTAYPMANLATGGWDAGGAAATVDKYTYISINQTTATQTITPPTPTLNTTYGRLLYISNIGNVSFTMLGTTVSAGTTATLVWTNANGGDKWTFAGADGSSILNQNASAQTANFQISGLGQANTSFRAPLFDVATAGVLSLGTATATGITVGGTATTGTIGIGNANVANTIQLGNSGGSAAQTINVGNTSGGTTALLLGSTNGASATTIQAGSAGTNLVGMGYLGGTSSSSVAIVDTTNFKLRIGTGTATLGGGGSNATAALYVSGAVEFAGQLRVGDGTNNVAVDGTTKEVTFNGTARHSKAVRLTAEFTGAVLDGDGTSNLGSMTAAYEATQRFGYYKFVTSQSSAQDYDVVVTVPVPDDFGAWTGSPTFFNYGSAGSSMTVTITDTAGTTATNYNASTLTTSTTWTARSVTTPAITGTYTQGSNMIIRIHMTAAATTGDVRLGTITLPYLSRW